MIFFGALKIQRLEITCSSSFSSLREFAPDKKIGWTYKFRIIHKKSSENVYNPSNE